MTFEVQEDGVHFDTQQEELCLCDAHRLSQELRRVSWEQDGAPKLYDKLYAYKQDGENIRVSTIGVSETEIYAKIRLDMNTQTFKMILLQEVLHPRTAWAVGILLTRLVNYMRKERR